MSSGFPAVHERLLSPFELAVLHERRRTLLRHARGTVVELGGTGANFELYPHGVERVVVAGPTAATRGLVARKARGTHLPVTLVDGDPATLADTLETVGIPPGTVDAVVSVLTLCAVPDLPATLDQVRRVLAPQGHLLFLEHVPTAGGLRLGRRLAAPLWRRAAGGCDLTRDVPRAVRAAGLAVTDLERFSVPTLTLPLRACAIGVARPSVLAGARP